MHNLMRHVAYVIIALGLVLGNAGFARPASAAEGLLALRYFSETGHNISGAIKTFYETRGDVRNFGLPLTEVVVENGRQVQYFERARFELHPQLPTQHYVQLTHLGRIFAAGRTGGAFAPVRQRTDARAYFPETGHNLSGIFWTAWTKRGGVPVFGYPISEPFEEVATDGVARLVQYFERARFEYHPENVPGTQVQSSHLGRQLLDRSSVPATARKPVPQLTLLASATTGYFGSFDERVNNIARGAGRMNGILIQPGETFSFNKALGDAGSESGFVEGYAIVGGRLEKVTGGGLCQVSTTMYRAVFNAGLEIVSRRNHSFVINFYENVPGWDATVYAPYTDFKWRNDTGGPIYMAAVTNPAQATVTFGLYGYNEGRKAQMVGPKVSNVTQPGIPIWQFDPTLKKGEVKQLVHGRPGMDVEMTRVVTGANGRAIHNDKLTSKYKPWEDFYVYGAGVTPPKGVTIIPPSTAAAAPSQ